VFLYVYKKLRYSGANSIDAGHPNKLIGDDTISIIFRWIH